jgi:hypothetical protein
VFSCSSHKAETFGNNEQTFERQSVIEDEPVEYKEAPEPQAAPAPEEPNVPSDDIEELIRNDHIGLFKRAIAKYEENITDYTGTFHKQERIEGKLHDKQVIAFKFKETPYSLLMTWKENPGRADKLLYVKGQYDGKMIIHPTGIMRWKKSLRRDPMGKDVMEENLNPCTEFGLGNAMKRILRDYQLAKDNGDLKAAYLGEKVIDSRPCALIERIFPEKKMYRYKRLVTAIDREHLVPVHMEATMWNGDLHSRYIFEDLRFNLGLEDKSFTPEANNL